MKDSLPRLCRVWLPLVLFLAAAVLVASRSDRIPSTGSSLTGDSPTNIRRPWSTGGPLRVGAPEPVRQATVLSPYGPGFEFELVAGFCRTFSCRPEWVVVPSKEAGFAMLRRDEIDVLVGFWGDGPPETGNADSSENAAEASLHEAVKENPLPGVATGRAYAHFNPVHVSGAGPDDGKDDEQPFPVYSHTMDATEDGNASFLLDPASYALWLPFMGDVSTRRIKQSTPFRWFWRNDGSPLAASLAGFWQEPERNHQLEELTERYFGFLPRNLRQRDILELAETLAAKLPEYETFIRNASLETGVPNLLLVAVIYQESRFDPDAVSQTKVRGIMQLTATTAKMLNVDRQDPEQCILGGARYLRDLYDRIGEKAATDWDRWFMALGAYNQGMSNLNRTIRIAQELGAQGNTWAALKRTFPLNTNCRGREARAFVERVRYYNFLLHGLVALAPAEAQNLAPLLGLAVADARL